MSLFDKEDCLRYKLWPIVESYFNENSLISQQVNSFNFFISNTIQEIIKKVPSIEIEKEVNVNDILKTYLVTIKFLSVHITTPEVTEDDHNTHRLFPNEARLRHMDYMGRIYVKALKKVKDMSTNKIIAESTETAFLGEIPIMVQSEFCNVTQEIKKGISDPTSFGECILDKGGYFIINGNERAIVGQERIASNRMNCFVSKGKEVCELRCAHPNQMKLKSMTTVSFTPPMRTSSLVGDVIRVTVPYIRETIPLCIILKALGVVSDKDITSLCCKNEKEEELLESSLIESFWVKTQDEAIDFISRRSDKAGFEKSIRISWARNLLSYFFIPILDDNYYHQTLMSPEMLPETFNLQTTFVRKSKYVGIMVNRILQLRLGKRPADDRDHFSCKRIDMTGYLLGSLFQNSINVIMRESVRRIKREMSVVTPSEISLDKCFNSEVIGRVFRYSLATGNWSTSSRSIFSTSSNDAGKTGVSQILQRLTYISAVSHLRRLHTPLNQSGKLAAPRMLHNTQWGKICPFETPEGLSVGIVKNLALLAVITVGDSREVARSHLETYDIIPLEDLEYHQFNLTRIILDGHWLGNISNPKPLINGLKNLRKYLNNPAEISIAWDIMNNEISVSTDSGRLSRPLLTVNKETNDLYMSPFDLDLVIRGELKFTDLVRKGYIEFLDAEEEERAYIATYPHEIDKHSHCEIHPSVILGVCASIIPFSDRNQSPRNTYQSAMGKHAMGVYSANYNNRFDTLAHVLNYPQKPLVSTKALDLLQYNTLPSGINCVVAIASYRGLNQEDSVVINRAAIDRGLFRSFSYYSYSSEESNNEEEDKQRYELIEKPDFTTTKGRRQAKYDLLDVDGLPAPGEKIHSRVAVIGRTIPSRISEIITFGRADDSVLVKSKEPCTVDKVLLTCKTSGERYVSVKTRAYRVPQIGDKFSSRHGQKGTVGFILDPEDMPFTASGISPDIIINPHCIPSRMTIGQILESITGKIATLNGKIFDASPFTKIKMEEVIEELKSYGFDKHGNETLYSGYTGHQIYAQIYMGPTYYQRLRHMVVDKIHSRARGPVNILTRQPVEGRAREGGLRIGEMERDCMVAHGTSAFLREKLFQNSDFYYYAICENCGLAAVYNEVKRYSECKGCDESGLICKVKIPYAAKLLLQELMGMGIAPRMEV
eukprot:GAHX01000519.1.p1 GENE.GAHX01000519.1~~GAHX01000519.1.p1  ORF type:complete len:1167 (+),score=188.27 GAHX01000519.1:619-4119(+)